MAIPTTEDDIAEIVETFTLRIIIPEELKDRQRGRGVVLGSINVTTIEIKDDDSEYSAVTLSLHKHGCHSHVCGNKVRFVAVQQHAISLLAQ